MFLSTENVVNGVGSVGKAQKLHPKCLGLSSSASSSPWWAILSSMKVLPEAYGLPYSISPATHKKRAIINK